MTDERLIEAARVAFVEAWEAERKKIGRGTAEPGTKTRAGIIAALAVFEKAHTVTERHSMSVTDSEAHTPTDDEREALRIAHLDARQAAYRKEREDWFVDHEAEPEIASNAFFRGWDAAVDGDFRRSEVPEPSAENGTPRDYQAYELTVDMLEDLLVTAGVSASEHGIAIRKTAGALVYKIGRCLVPEPQGEPSDAQV